jgi:hypothetical protein
VESKSSAKVLTPKAEQLASDLLRDNREELAKADAKTGILLATVSVVIGVLLAGIVAGDWTPSHLQSGPQAVWWVGVAFTLLGLLFLILAVAPRGVVRRRKPEQACYFGDVEGCRSEEQLAALLLKQSDGESDRTLDQILATARITRVKYLLIWWALVALGIGVALTMIAVLIG